MLGLLAVFSVCEHAAHGAIVVPVGASISVTGPKAANGLGGTRAIELYQQVAARFPDAAVTLDITVTDDGGTVAGVTAVAQAYAAAGNTVYLGQCGAHVRISLHYLRVLH